MTNLLASKSAISVAELSADEIALVSGGDATVQTTVVIECKIDENGNGQCTTTISEKPD